MKAQNSTKLSKPYVKTQKSFLPSFLPTINTTHSVKKRKIRLRLHGTRLPPNYTLSLRLLASHNRHSQPSPPARRKRRRDDPGLRDHHHHQRADTPCSSDEQGVELDDHSNDATAPNTTTLNSTTAPPPAQPEPPTENPSDAQIRLSNAYPGAINSIHSIHQRRWYLSLDRHSSGFARLAESDGAKRWVRRRDEEGRLGGFETFFVRGREVERSVVTGRMGGDVLGDEGVEGFVGRKGWRAVVE